MTEEVNLPDWAAEVLSLLEGHRELSTDRIIRELEFADKATAYTVLRPLAASGTILKEKRGGYLYWGLPTRGHARLIEESNPTDRGLKNEPTRGRLIGSKNDNDAPTNRRAPQKILTLEGWKSDYRKGMTIDHGTIPEVLDQLIELEPILRDLNRPDIRKACLDAGAVLRKEGKYRNYDWIIDMPPCRWGLSVVVIAGGTRQPAFLTIRRFYGGT